MLKWIRDTTRKSRAAVAIQNQFESLPIPFIIPGGTAKFANELVTDAWSDDATIFDGRAGATPHFLSVAVLSLARGMETHEASVVVHTICKGALGQLLMLVEAQRFKLALNGNDQFMLDLATEVYTSHDWKLRE